MKSFICEILTCCLFLAGAKNRERPVRPQCMGDELGDTDGSSKKAVYHIGKLKLEFNVCRGAGYRDV